VSFFLEERLSALRFTVNELSYDQLKDSDQLAVILKNLKWGFGGLTDLSVIDQTGIQIAYAGPFNLTGRDYSDQHWFIECQKYPFYVSEIFRGYRQEPHIIIAVKSVRPDGSFFITRATLDTERLRQTLVSYQTGAHADIFLVNRSGIVQTPSKLYGDIFEKMALPTPPFFTRTQTVMTTDDQNQSIITGYAFIRTQITDTPFILMVIKQKAGMMGTWREFGSNIRWLLGFSIVIIVMVITVICTFAVNKLYLADKSKAETMALMEQNNQLAAIGQLAAGVAHEINNPLALINQTAGFIKDLFVIKKQYSEDEELLDSIDTILEAVDRCGTITKQLLGFARKFSVKIQKVNLRTAISDVLIFHQKEPEYRNIQVAVVVDEQIEIETDRGKLQQILLNLVNNAFQALRNGGRLGIGAWFDGPDHVVLTIKDNGCGMAEKDLPKIFEPFFTTKERGQGTGLGLAITYGLIRKLHGEIAVASQKDKGTSFTITLPLRFK
jgi:signal transduction histidine kinase